VRACEIVEDMLQTGKKSMKSNKMLIHGN
jgi:hypothetical protein